MRATEYLSREHRVIEQMLGVLEAFAEGCRKPAGFDGELARTAVSFVSEYADALHHRKEEDLLFARMRERGFPGEHGPLGVMLAEHDEGRARVAEMRSSLAPADGKRFAAAAFSYAELLRGHIAKEDQILYRMADEALTEADQRELLAAFERIDAGAAQAVKRHDETAAALGRRYRVSRRSIAEALASGMPACGM